MIFCPRSRTSLACHSPAVFLAPFIPISLAANTRSGASHSSASSSSVVMALTML